MRLILIDHNSGFIWGDTADINGKPLHLPGWANGAVNAVTAVRALDASLGTFDRVYEFLGHKPRDTATHYLVYLAPETLPVAQDGQDAEAIAAVERECEFVGAVRCLDDADF